MRPILEFNWRHASILRMLLYPVQFDSYPLQGIDCVLARDVLAIHSKLRPSEIAAAIDAGLASRARLSELVPMNHSEEVIRNYFSKMRTRLNVGPLRRHMHDAGQQE